MIIELIFNGEVIDEIRIKFRKRDRRARRGRYVRGTFDAAFGWTSAVKAFSFLAVAQYVSQLGDRNKVAIVGGAGSIAASLDLALDRKTNWLLEVFGLDGQRPIFESLFERKNPRGRKGEKVEISFRDNILTALDLKIIDRHIGLMSHSQASLLLTTLLNYPVKHNAAPTEVESISVLKAGPDKLEIEELPLQFTNPASALARKDCGANHSFGSVRQDTIGCLGLSYAWLEDKYRQELMKTLYCTNIFSEAYLTRAHADLLRYGQAFGGLASQTLDLFKPMLDGVVWGIGNHTPLTDILKCDRLVINSTPAHLGSLCIFKLLSDRYHIPVDLNIMNTASHKLAPQMRNRDLSPSSLFILTVPGCIRELCFDGSAYIPISIMPSITHTLIEAGPTSKALSYGFLGMDTAFEDDLGQKSLISGRDKVERELDFDRQVERLSQPDNSTLFRTAIYFPLNHFLTSIFKCREVAVDTSEFICSRTVLFIAKDLVPTINQRHYFIRAIRDCWFMLLENLLLREQTLRHVLNYAGCLEFFLRFSHISRHALGLGLHTRAATDFIEKQSA